MVFLTAFTVTFFPFLSLTFLPPDLRYAAPDFAFTLTFCAVVTDAGICISEASSFPFLRVTYIDAAYPVYDLSEYVNETLYHPPKYSPRILTFAPVLSLIPAPLCVTTA